MSQFEDPREILLDLVQRGSTLPVKDWPENWPTITTCNGDFVQCALCYRYGQEYMTGPKLEDHSPKCPFVRAYKIVKEYYE